MLSIKHTDHNSKKAAKFRHLNTVRHCQGGCKNGKKRGASIMTAKCYQIEAIHFFGEGADG